MITLVSILINLWVPFLFKIQQLDAEKQYCDVEKDWKSEYFIITIVYTALIMLVPIITIFICNSLIIMKTRKADLSRKRLQMIRNSQVIQNININMNLKTSKVKYKLKPYYVSANQNTNTIRRKNENSKKLAQTLFLVSFSYAFLNLPYLITWYVYFISISFKRINENGRNYLFGAVQLCEILYGIELNKFHLFTL